MPAFNFALGMNAKIYRKPTLWADGNSAEVIAAIGSLVVMGNCKDVTINLETGEADITTRENDGWRATAGTLKDGSVEFESQFKYPDTNLSAIRDAWLNSTEIALLVLTGPVGTEGHEGIAANFTVTNFSRNEALEEAITYQVTLKPSSKQQWYTTAT